MAKVTQTRILWSRVQVPAGPPKSEPQPETVGAFVFSQDKLKQLLRSRPADTTNLKSPGFVFINNAYWCGVFGELYGSAVESRFAKDILEVPAWLDGGPEPTTVSDGVLRPDRLLTMRSRLSAAYKGLQALLLREGAIDFRSGQAFDQIVFFDEGVDIHHIFPKAWCESQTPKLPASLYDSVVNKTPLGYRTNRIIGGVAPSSYLEKLEKGKVGTNGQIIEPPIDKAALADYLKSHCIPVQELYADDVELHAKLTH